MPFDEFQLKPGFEANELRIDIIQNYRQAYYTLDTYMLEVMPCHPMAFDLGNRLFYDLHGNLSVRVHHMIGISSDSAFVIRAILNPMTKWRNPV